jgi:PEGA domain
MSELKLRPPKKRAMTDASIFLARVVWMSSAGYDGQAEATRGNPAGPARKRHATNLSKGDNVRRHIGLGIATFLAIFLVLSVAPISAAQNQVLGEVEIQGKTNVDKTSGVWVDGQYVGFVKELKDDKKLLLLPGEHEIEVRQAGYVPVTDKVTVEPGKKTTIRVHLLRNPKAEFPSGATSQIKLEVTPDRAAVFVDGGYVGTPQEFSGLGRAMVIAPGKHQIKIALAGYKDFTTEVNLRPKQKITIKTDLIPGVQPGPALKSN